MDNSEIYAKHADELVRFATAVVGPSQADDVVAEAVMRAFRTPGWRLVTDQRAYLFRATLNQARQVRRESLRRLRRESAVARQEQPEPEPVRAEVLDALSRLRPRQRAVVFFTYWEDLDGAEVARLLGVSTRTVQRELATARRLLEVLLR